MSVVKYFSVNSIKSKFPNKENVDSDTGNISKMNEKCDKQRPTFPYFKHLETIDPSFVTITKKIRAEKHFVKNS